MEKVTFTGKVVVVGAGNVGATVAYSILLNNLCNDLVIIDVAKDKASGEALDMKHATSFFKPIRVRDGEYSECADADVIVVTAGVGRKPGQTRLDLAKINVGIAKDIAKSIIEYNKNPMIVVVSNPVDIITYVIQKETGLPKNRVIGSGTSLDTARLRYSISEQLNLDVRDVNAFMVGEHGDSMFPVWSCANVAGAPLKDMLDESGVNCEEILKRTIDGGAEIIRKKGATFYGIGSSTAKIVSAILHDENAVLPLSKVAEGEYGLEDVALGLPYVLNKNGISHVINIPMDEEEKKLLNASAEKLKGVIKDVLG